MEVIRPEDLRIGSYIYYEATTHVITGLLDEVCISEWIGTEENNPYNHRYDELEPIPLNEEWLLRFGFFLDEETDEYCSSDSGCVLHIEGYLQKEMTETCYGIKLKYVHQLMNFYFALTGKDLELKQTEAKQG